MIFEENAMRKKKIKILNHEFSSLILGLTFRMRKMYQRRIGEGEKYHVNSLVIGFQSVNLRFLTFDHDMNIIKYESLIPPKIIINWVASWELFA